MDMKTAFIEARKSSVMNQAQMGEKMQPEITSASIGNLEKDPTCMKLKHVKVYCKESQGKFREQLQNCIFEYLFGCDGEEGAQ